MQRKRVLRGESIGNVYVQGIISRPWRDAVRSSRAGEMRVSLLCNNSEPRPPQTTGALMFGWPPKEALQYKLKLASHRRAAIVQRFAETQMATKPVVLHQRFVVTVERPSTSARAVTVDTATAVKRALMKRAWKSVAATTAKIEKVSKDDEIMRTGKVSIDAAQKK